MFGTFDEPMTMVVPVDGGLRIEVVAVGESPYEDGGLIIRAGAAHLSRIPTAYAYTLEMVHAGTVIPEDMESAQEVGTEELEKWVSDHALKALKGYDSLIEIHKKT